jgi:hypothetical protein
MEEETVAEGLRYYIDLDGAAEHGRSMVAIVAARKCYEHRSVADSTGDSKSAEHVKEIKGHCADTADYLLPDTPLKEAIFRLLLAGGNKETTAAEVSQGLETRWAMSSYPRNISPGVIGRLLANSGSYGIVAVPEPEPEPPAEIAPPTAEVTELSVDGGDEAEGEAPAEVPAAEESGDSSEGDSD